MCWPDGDMSTHTVAAAKEAATKYWPEGDNNYVYIYYTLLIDGKKDTVFTLTQRRFYANFCQNLTDFMYKSTKRGL